MLERFTSEKCAAGHKHDGRSDRNDPDLTDYLGSIVSAATLAPPGIEIDTALRCRRRPNRKPCHGFIRVHLKEFPPELSWWCPECGDSGIIRNWRGTPWNLSHARATNSENGDEFCEVLLADKEYLLLKGISILEPGAERIVECAVPTSRGVILVGPIADMDALMGYIAFEVNHESRQRRQGALIKIFENINRVIKGRW